MPKILLAHIRCAVIIIVALLLASMPVLGLPPGAPPPAAHAFGPDIHIEMFQATVGGQFSSEAQAAVAEGLEYSDSTDLGAGLNLVIKPFITIGPGQEHAEWHFDNALNPETICKLWHAHDPAITGPKQPKGPNKLLVDAGAYAVEAFRPDSPEFRVGTFRQLALFHYGQYLHAIQDFYAHTNWIELHAAAGKQAGLAPIQAGCDPAALAAAVPAGAGRLQSGNFNVHANWPDMCDYTIQWVFFLPRALLPAGYDYCHGPPETLAVVVVAGSTWLKPRQMLAKDSPDRYHGAEKLTLPDGTQTTYHQEARRLATLATTASLPVFHDRVVADLKQHLPERDPECLFQVLLKGGDPACPKRVGLGSFFEGEALAVDDSVLAPWEDYPDQPRGPVLAQPTTALRNVRVSIEVEAGPDDDVGVRFIRGGSLTFEISAKEGGGRYAYTATQARGVVHSVADGYSGNVNFTGTMTFTQPDGSQTVFSDYLEPFGLAVDAAGQMVLCPPLPGPDPVQTYQDCLARAVVRLEPAQALPVA